MPKLNQILAVEKGAKDAAKRAETDIYHLIQQTGLFAGRLRTYEPKNDEGDTLPDETQLVVAKAQEITADFVVANSRLMDVTATKVYANTEAKADVVLNGVTIMTSVPVEYLLFLEKQCVDLATVFGKLPTLDPTQKWLFDSVNGWYESLPVVRNRVIKVMQNHIKAPATDKHPAQVETYMSDQLEGYWTQIDLSGALPPAEKAALLARIAALAAAVKMAREEANSIQVTDQSVGADIFSYLFPAPTGA